MTASNGTWRNRIVGHELVAPDHLTANPKNWRIHPTAQQEALTGVLDEVGFVQSIIVSVKSGYVIDGHMRVALALKQGQPLIPVVYVDLDEAEEAKVLASLDPIAALAGTDAQQLDSLLRDVDTGSAALMQMLSDMATDAGIAPFGDTSPEIGAGGDEFDATPQDGPTRVQRGDVWSLGKRATCPKCKRVTNVR